MNKAILLLALFASFFAVSSAQSCSECELVVGLVEGWISNNNTVTEVEKLLDTFCKWAPSSFQASCDAIIAQGVPWIYAYIQNNESPAQVCTQLGVCSSLSAKVLVRQGGDVCLLCQSVIGAIDGWLASNLTETQIQNQLESLCGLVPSFQNICDASIILSLPKIITWLNQHLGAQQICSLLKLC
eukprot:TRINITY_DN21646_c0_g1_i1.p1 TRINITY_DN21646_c0_g1~~TRINITY_DN21646_c0_g1_i1.p1  ORF type:complete len:185 (+),score=35.32 TRINITY_DN21646_c0_g1_i1:135-689(+)